MWTIPSYYLTTSGDSSKRQKNLADLAEKNPPVFKKDMIVIDHQVPQSKATDSRELEPAAHHLYRVKDVQPKNLRVVSIIDGSERSLPYELVRPMSMPDLMDMRYSLNHLYLNLHFNRLSKNNRFIGPDATKTWRRITMKKNKNEAQQEQHDAQETNTYTYIHI